MTLFWVHGQVVDDQEGSVPAGSPRVDMFRNQAQYGSQEFAWDPSNRYFSGNIQENAPGYLTTLMGWLDRERHGDLKPYEAEQLRGWEATARAMPMRDISTLRAGWQGDLGGSWGGGATEGNPEWWGLLDPGSPDAGPIMLNLRDKVQHGTATPQERQLYQQVASMAADWDYRASVPQESDANPFGMGDQLFGALMMLGMGASGGAAAGALAAGGLTLGSAGGLAGFAGGLTSMMGEALDEDVLRKMGISLGAVGGAAGLAALASSGISTVGDLLKVVQKAYGVGSKAYGLATGAGSTPDRPGGGGGMADTRTDFIRGGGNTGSTGGGILDSLGPLLGGVIGAVGTGMQLSDVSRYMDQLKARYGQQEDAKRLIDEAYKLAVARYDTFYAQSQAEYQQKQRAYEDQLGKYQTAYGDTRLQQEQQQIQYLKESGQIDEDRARQLTTWNENRRLDLENFQERRSQALEDRASERGIFTDQYGRHLTREDEIAAQVRRDRDTQYDAWGEQYGRHLTREDERAAQARDERGLDLNAYQQRQAVGRNLSDPAAIAAGAQALYQPLSAAARDRINVQTEEEMARRGVAGGGQYSNLMAAKAFAPQEAQLYQNAMQNYLTGQQGAVSAYSQQDMTQVPGYEWAQRPEFSTSPRYNYMGMPDFATSPDYTGVNAPDFLRAGSAKVPGAVARPGDYPGAPAVDWNALRVEPKPPGSDSYYPTPYKPWGSDSATGGGEGGPLANAGALATQLGKLLGGNTGLVSQVMKLLGIGGGGGITPNASGYDSPIGPGLGWDAGGYDYQQGYDAPIGPGLGWDPMSNYFPEYDYSNLGDIDYSLF